MKNTETQSLNISVELTKGGSTLCFRTDQRLERVETLTLMVYRALGSKFFISVELLAALWEAHILDPLLLYSTYREKYQQKKEVIRGLACLIPCKDSHTWDGGMAGRREGGKVGRREERGMAL